jgi:hypothetical protein
LEKVVAFSRRKQKKSDGKPQNPCLQTWSEATTHSGRAPQLEGKTTTTISPQGGLKAARGDRGDGVTALACFNF